MLDMATLDTVSLTGQQSYRLVNAKLPPISLFDDVADADEFDLLYELQEITNPRIQNEVGNLNLLPKDQIPFGIAGCSYATASFTHVNPDGSRFSDGSYGVLYLADSPDTAIAETRYHQDRYLSNIEGLHYDVITMRGLACRFDGDLFDITRLGDGAIYHETDYAAPRQFAEQVRKEGGEGLQYRSVRNEGATCWALFTPKRVKAINQSAHFEFIWNGKTISKVETISQVRQ